MSIDHWENSIQWNLFNSDERQQIQKCLDAGLWQKLGAVINLADPVREFQIQKLIDQLRPKTVGFDSKVREQMRGVDLSDPAVEAEWQRKLNEEFAAWREKQEAKNKKVEEKKVELLEETTPVVEAIKVEIPVEAVKDETPKVEETSSLEPAKKEDGRKIRWQKYHEEKNKNQIV